MQIFHAIGAYGKAAALQAHDAVSTSCAWYERISAIAAALCPAIEFPDGRIGSIDCPALLPIQTVDIFLHRGHETSDVFPAAIELGLIVELGVSIETPGRGGFVAHQRLRWLGRHGQTDGKANSSGKPESALFPHVLIPAAEVRGRRATTPEN